jgi:chromosome partitioning protein
MARPKLVLTSSNRKGGCFKTSSVYHLGGALAQKGKRVLLVDTDPQASLSQTFFGSVEIEQFKEEESLVALFNDRYDPDPGRIIYETTTENIWIVPGCDGLSIWNQSDPAGFGKYEQAIATFLAGLGEHFDCVLIDTPPNLQMLTWSALVASDFCITPVIPEDYAAQGLVHVKRFIRACKEKSNPRLDWLGLVVAMVQSRLAVHTAYETVLRENYADFVFQTTVPLAAVFKEAIAARKPVSIYKKNTKPAKAIIALADEILERAESQNDLAIREAA